MADAALPFRHFRNALRANQDAARALKSATYYRFAKGEMPQNFEWFLEYPEMLEALAQDAREMSPEDWARFRKTIRKRAKAARASRERQG